MFTAAVVGSLAIRLVRWLVKTDKFVFFAWYTLALGLLTVVAAMIEKLSGQTIVQMLS